MQITYVLQHFIQRDIIVTSSELSSGPQIIHWKLITKVTENRSNDILTLE
jgi:hypothetical protein